MSAFTYAHKFMKFYAATIVRNVCAYVPTMYSKTSKLKILRI